MKYDLAPIKVVLCSFLTEMEDVKKIRRRISAPIIATAFSVASKIHFPESIPIKNCKDRSNMGLF